MDAMDLFDAPEADKDDVRGTLLSWKDYAFGAGLAISAWKIGDRTVGTGAEMAFDWAANRVMNWADEATEETNDAVDVF